MNNTENKHSTVPGQYRIRLIERKDNLSTAQMIRSVFEEYNAPKEGTVFADPSTNKLYELFESEDKAVFWVAVDEQDMIVGSCGIFPTQGLPSDTVEIVKLYVSSQTQGSGIGSKLFDLSIQSAINAGYSNIYLETIELFSKAIDMYKRRGFEFLEEPMGNSGHHSCDIKMIKRL